MAYAPPKTSKELRDNILSYKDLIRIYKKYCKGIDSNVIHVGYPTLHGKIRGLRKQELMTIQALTGVGKSILLLNFILNFLNTSNELALIFSLEMADFGIAERIMQIRLKIEGELIEKGFISEDKSMIDDAEAQEKFLNRLHIVAKRVDVHEIPEYVRELVAKERVPVGLIGCDHVSILKNKYHPRDEYGRITDNMVKLYDYSKDLNVAILNVSQMARGKLSSDLQAGKGSGEVENSSDFLISIELVSLETDYAVEKQMLKAVADSAEPDRYKHMKLLRRNSYGNQ